MKLIALPRGKGKTTELIKLSAEKWGYIVCRSREESHRISSEARRMGLDIPFPITYHNFLSRAYHSPGIKCFLLDDADAFFQSLTTVKVEAISMTV